MPDEEGVATASALATCRLAPKVGLSGDYRLNTFRCLSKHSYAIC